jgi:hypothetical protein
MLLWMVIAGFVLPLAYLIWDLHEERGARAARLKRLRQRIEKKEADAALEGDD